ncbi:MAG: baeRF7 domain-containing protein [Anaerolineae bacterium]
MQKPGGFCTSILMPTYRTGADTQQNPIRFRNLLQVAEQQLVDSGVRPPDARSQLQPATDLLGNADFWRNCIDGLAVFVSRSVFGAYRLPLQFREQVVVNDRFHIKPLLPLFSNDGHFYVLALSQNEVRLLEGTRLTVKDVGLEGADVPANLAEALKYDDFERQLQFHTGSATPGGARSAMFHGNEVLKDIAKTNILRYFQQVDHGLHELLRDQRIPLILAGVEYLLPIYKEANTYNYLMDEGIPGNPEIENAQALHAQAWTIVGPHFTREQDETIGRYRQFAGTGLASGDVGLIAAAAYQGRVDTLLTANSGGVLGAYRPESGDVALGADVPGAEDLSDFASMHTILNGGEVYVLPLERMPTSSGMAAVFRY